MVRVRDISRALKLAALWLLVVSVFLGPAALGRSVAFASVSATSACGVSCPCDEAVSDHHPRAQEERTKAAPCNPEGDPEGDHEGDHEGDSRAGSDHDAGEPCQDECPEDCPDCSCCLGVALAVLPLALTSSVTSCASERMLSPAGVLANGSCTGVFRPPRSVT